jgi:hypothetical protein
MRADRHQSPTDLPPGLWSELSDMVARLRRELFAGYRPERHYMRGPGPAWQAKRIGI